VTARARLATLQLGASCDGLDGRVGAQLSQSVMLCGVAACAPYEAAGRPTAGAVE
jgi:hypothetical protein